MAVELATDLRIFSFVTLVSPKRVSFLIATIPNYRCVSEYHSPVLNADLPNKWARQKECVFRTRFGRLRLLLQLITSVAGIALIQNVGHFFVHFADVTGGCHQLFPMHVHLFADGTESIREGFPDAFRLLFL